VLSKNVKIVQNNQKLTMWLATESASIPGTYNRADFDSL